MKAKDGGYVHFFAEYSLLAFVVLSNYDFLFEQVVVDLQYR